MRRTLAGLTLALSLAVPAGGGGADGAAGPGGLANGAGRDEVAGLCGACHSVRLVIQQRLARDRWAEILDLMVDEHEMPRLAAEEEQAVLDYLARFYGPDRGSPGPTAVPQGIRMRPLRDRRRGDRKMRGSRARKRETAHDAPSVRRQRFSRICQRRRQSCMVAERPARIRTVTVK